MALADSSAPVRSPTKAQRQPPRRRQRIVSFYSFIAPWLFGLVFLTTFPMFVGFLTSLTNYDGLNFNSLQWVGLENYGRAFTDEDAGYSFGQSLKWTALNLPLWMVLSFVLALILNQDVKGRGVFRTLYYLPGVVPSVALVWIWRIILDQNVGLLNALVSLFRPGTAIPWLGEYSLEGLTWISIWSGLGAGMVVFLAGLQGIPEELLEAAHVDGANAMQVFRHVTIPLMTPVIFYQLVNGLISAFQQLVLPILLATGAAAGGRPAPPRPAYLFMVHVDRQIFSLQRFGYGVALLWLLFIFVAFLTFLLFKSEPYWVHTEVEEQRRSS